MKKLLCLTALLLAALCLFASCKKEEKHEHKFTEWSVTKNPTCTEDGVKSRYCDCGEKQTDAVPAKGHTFIDGVCTECDFNKNTECKHNSLEILQGFAATCTETGLTEGKKCTTCMNIIVEQEIIPALDHNKRTYTEKDENCNVYNVTVCDRNGCDFTDRVATGVISHAFGEWERVNNVTGSPCGVDKIYKRTCAVCSANEEKVEPTAGHNYKATIISTHSFNSATHEASIGEIKYTCQNANCNSIYYEYENHEYAQTIVNSTCAEQGYTLYSCACGHSYKSDFTDKLPHIPGAEATCTTAQTCTQCYEIITPALGHDWKDATCTDPKTCQRCAVTDGEESGHNFGEWVTVKEPTTTEEGLMERTCICGAKETETIAVKAPEESTYVRDGDFIYFGEYPQTIKADDISITETQDSRGYYLGSDGYYYAKVTATPYESGYTFSTGITVTCGTEYYFKVEPIRWRILSEENGEAFILCDSIISDHRFDDSSNNYAESEIRLWLNDTFYEIAFSEYAKKLILTTEVDNSALSTGFEDNPYICENTYDKIFLLSGADVINSDYGFGKYNSPDVARRFLTTDYSRAIGTYVYTTKGDFFGFGGWWLRSSSSTKPELSRQIDIAGYGGGLAYVYSAGGIVPALRITL